jgi:hypothetical protein
VGSKPLGANEEKQRVEKRDDELSEVLSRLELIGDPMDDLDISEKKKHALFLFYDRIKVKCCLFVSCSRVQLYRVTHLFVCLVHSASICHWSQICCGVVISFGYWVLHCDSFHLCLQYFYDTRSLYCHSPAQS